MGMDACRQWPCSWAGFLFSQLHAIDGLDQHSECHMLLLMRRVGHSSHNKPSCRPCAFELLLFGEASASRSCVRLVVFATYFGLRHTVCGTREPPQHCEPWRHQPGIPTLQQSAIQGHMPSSPHERSVRSIAQKMQLNAASTASVARRNFGTSAARGIGR